MVQGTPIQNFVIQGQASLPPPHPTSGIELRGKVVCHCFDVNVHVALFNGHRLLGRYLQMICLIFKHY